jgi:hypothetical protein
VRIAYEPSGVVCTIQAPLPDSSEKIEDLSRLSDSRVVFDRR